MGVGAGQPTHCGPQESLGLCLTMGVTWQVFDQLPEDPRQTSLPSGTQTPSTCFSVSHFSCRFGMSQADS